jgi:periplasmic mercuric ion binding protein
MKTLKIISIAIIVILMGSNSYAQMHDHSKMDMSKKTDPKIDMASAKTETIKVSGNCGMCKERIEKAAKVKGVSKADWNKDTKTLTLVYNPAVVKSDDVQKGIAAVGHDTEKFKADTKTYNSLPGCCKYR